MRCALIFALACLLCAPLTLAPLPAKAVDGSVAESGKRKINLSGRQRMLSQRIAKAACFAAIAVDTEQHLEQVSAAHALFETTLHGLRHGHDDMGLTAESNARILTEMDGVEELWQAYGPYADRATFGQQAAQKALPVIASLNLPVLRQMNRAVEEFERHYSNAGPIHPSLALALNIAGRQRMLSQKASKEFCMIVAGRDPKGHRAALAKSVTLFESTLNALIYGSDDLGLPPAPTQAILEQLQEVQALWTPLVPAFKKVIDGGLPTSDEIRLVAEKNNPLLIEMNKAVQMYEEL